MDRFEWTRDPENDDLVWIGPKKMVWEIFGVPVRATVEEINDFVLELHSLGLLPNQCPKCNGDLHQVEGFLPGSVYNVCRNCDY